MYLRVLGGCGGANAPDLAAGEGWLENIGGVEGAFGRAGADERVQLIDEHDDVRVLGELLHDRLEPLLELAAVLRAGDDQGDVEREDSLVGEKVRDVAAGDFLRQPFDNGGLAHARFANQHRVVLRAPAEHLLETLELDAASDERVELVLDGRLAEIAAELGKERRLLRTYRRRLLVEELDDVFAHAGEPHALVVQDRGGH